MELEGRKRYRVTPADEHSLSVTVKTVDGQSYAGELLDLTIEGAGTRFLRDAGPTLAVGQAATLTFTSARLHKPIRVPAKVRSRAELGAFRSYRYGFEFDDFEALSRRLSREISQLFNQRTLYRVTPDPAAPVHALIRLPEKPIAQGAFEAAGTVRDICGVGLAIVVNRDVETALAATDFVEICLQLPPRDNLLQLASWIRHRELLDEGVCYGLEFDTNRSNAFQQQQNEILRYVRRRQLQESPR